MLLLVETNALTVDNLIKPSDKQNVPNATKFLLTFTKAVRDDDSHYHTVWRESDQT